MSQADLAQLFDCWGSDKEANGYSTLCSILLTPLRNSPITLLEVGIGTMLPGHSSMLGYMPDTYKPGASLRAWRDFFPDGKIHGMDVQPDCMFAERRIQTHLCDSTNETDCQRWKSQRPGLIFDILIDDASHWGIHQLQTLRNLWDLIKPGGLYIIEDVCVGSEVSAEPHKLLDIVGDVPIFFAGLKNNLCIIQNVPLKCSRKF
jgi:trans-aconitate methyltransferase